MSRQEKIGAVVLGLLLFSGLFYFIYTTMKNPLPSEFGDEGISGDNFNNEDLTDEDQTAPDEEAPALSTGTVDDSTGPVTAPAAAPAKK